MRNWKRACSNRGGALLSVIIAMTVVGILGTLVLSISYTNFRMKQVDKKSKDNFYSAEAVLDEICVKLQEEVSRQYKKAYTTVMENYGSYSSAQEMSDEFKVEFVLNMVDVYKKAADDTEHYDLDDIKAYVNLANYPSTAEITIYSPIIGYDTTGVQAGEQGTPIYGNLLDTLETVETDGVETQKAGLSLRNLVVSYEDGSYVNTITTDIKISVPELEFARISNMPEIADYSMIAEGGMAVEGDAYYSINGKAYAGADIALAAESSLDLNNADATLLVAKGDITAVSGAKFSTAETTSLWANGVTASAATGQKVGANEISLLGRTYIKDDTTISGSGNVLTLGGQYYGYNTDSAKAADSSAVIINGSGTTLNMANLKTLIVAGTSFVATDRVETEGNRDDELNTADVLMGDSIAVKGNQIAYLVPTECRGIVSNPMSYDQFKNLVDTNPDGWDDEALNTQISSLGRSLASYGGISIQPVYTGRDQAVQLYLSFEDADVASKYFMDYYGTDAGAKIQEYLNRYVTAFTFNEDAMNRLVTQGNYLVPETEVTGMRVTYSGNTGDVATSAQELSNYQSSFEALCAKLVENKSTLSSAELSQTVYQNLIDQSGINEFMAACAGNTSNKWSDNIGYEKITVNASTVEVATIWANSSEKGTGTGVRCIIVDNDDAGDDAYTLPANGSGIIIATGDIDVTGLSATAWSGLIISNGKLTMSSGGSNDVKTLRADANAVAQAMQYVSCVGETTVEAASTNQIFSVMNFFIGGGEFSVGEASDAQGAKVDVRDCISFENWQSE